MGAEQTGGKPTITPQEAFRRRRQFVEASEATVNKVDGTPGKKSRARRKDFDKTARELIVESFTIIPAKRS